ncbi:hypothetical protein DIPPA_07080 [Diplonema papillatum]|nr:hypothetical protein DIPPA_07080 [Diplonema papillatum]
MLGPFEQVPATSNEPRTNLTARPGRADVRPYPWLPSDSDRDPSKKYTEAEMQERYGMAPDVRKVAEPGTYIPVQNVPKDMYTYGREGQKVQSICIFKDQKAPTIRATHEYPFIWHFLDGVASPRSMEDWEAVMDSDEKTPEHVVMRNIQTFRHGASIISSYKFGPPRPKKSRARGGKKK